MRQSALAADAHAPAQETDVSLQTESVAGATPAKAARGERARWQPQRAQEPREAAPKLRRTARDERSVRRIAPKRGVQQRDGKRVMDRRMLDAGAAAPGLRQRMHHVSERCIRKHIAWEKELTASSEQELAWSTHSVEYSRDHCADAPPPKTEGGRDQSACQNGRDGGSVPRRFQHLPEADGLPGCRQLTSQVQETALQGSDQVANHVQWTIVVVSVAREDGKEIV